ncbi:acetyltransferase (GNAT) family protein [mine drainage metagenome]|uniref:Acetyltransferase (GNAT) family protein n=1 Tax=mine drainage metagenome TaxID=410659 RepID=A0A1J5SVD5_9ZZZZ
MSLAALSEWARLRPLAPQDIPVLAQACAAMDPWRQLRFSAAALARYFQKPDPSLDRFVIETDDLPQAGLLFLRAPWLRGPFLEMLALLPAAQGRGLGAAAVRWAQAQAGGNLWVTVSAFNHRARAFYAAQGFVPVAELPDLLVEGQSEILLRIRL